MESSFLQVEKGPTESELGIALFRGMEVPFLLENGKEIKVNIFAIEAGNPRYCIRGAYGKKKFIAFLDLKTGKGVIEF